MRNLAKCNNSFYSFYSSIEPREPLAMAHCLRGRLLNDSKLMRLASGPKLLNFSWGMGWFYHNHAAQQMRLTGFRSSNNSLALFNPFEVFRTTSLMIEFVQSARKEGAQAATTLPWSSRIQILQSRLEFKVVNTIQYLLRYICADLFSVAPGYRIVQVRLLFQLPTRLQLLREHIDDPLAHLAYVEYFTPFETEYEPGSKFYKVLKSYVQHKRKTAVIPVTSIFRSCHLIPQWGSSVDRTWTSNNVLEKCHSFYLNSFSDHFMYLFV